MCGIAGYLHRDSRRPPDVRVLERMTGCIRHRGPDDIGHFAEAGVALGACRLSIIDLPGGHQPISNEDGSCWVAYNGEIYNFAAVRDELLARGHEFRTKCDTEVLVHAYEQFGLDFVRELDGMFAFALWDGRQRRLVLGRDRLGIKPLYYAEVGDALVFGSEIKSILEYPGVERRVDLHALDNILTLEYNPDEGTIFAGIRKLPPGHLIVAEHGRPGAPRRYWDLNGAAGRLDFRAAVEAVREEVDRAVRSHLMSDVPLGVFLSGGMDSSSIVALMSRADAGPVKTFSIGFKDGEGYDELAYARTVARHFGTEHHEFVLEPDAVRILPRLVWHLEEPIADEAALPLWVLSARAREHVKVVLVGDGGDEVFAGYGRYFWYHAVDRYRRLPAVLRKGLLEPVIRALPSIDGNAWRPRMVRRAKRLLDVGYEPEERRFSVWNRIFSEDEKRSLYGAELRQAAGEGHVFDAHRRAFAEAPFTDPISRAQYVDQKTYLAECLLLKSDKVTSAFSLECRVPLLDRRVVELAASLPASFKYRRGRTKRVLREAMKGLLPPAILARRKQGFVLPLGRWFRDDLPGFAREVLLDRRALARGYFDARGVRRLLEQTSDVDDRFARKLYALLVFEMWNRVFIDRTAPADLGLEVAR